MPDTPSDEPIRKQATSEVPEDVPVLPTTGNPYSLYTFTDDGIPASPEKADYGYLIEYDKKTGAQVQESWFRFDPDTKEPPAPVTEEE